jgi:hypothetical protein
MAFGMHNMALDIDNLAFERINMAQTIINVAIVGNNLAIAKKGMPNLAGMPFLCSLLYFNRVRCLELE